MSQTSLLRIALLGLTIAWTSAADEAAAQATVDQACMQESAGFDLNCTANDVQIANARNITILDDGCAFPGDTVEFEAEFEVLLTAQERHDVGIYFATDGDLNGDGAVSGSCSVSTVPFSPEPLYVDLDGTGDGGFCVNDPSLACSSRKDCRRVGGSCAFQQDTCGDIDDGHNPLFPRIQLSTACIDPDGDGKLNLPNCTSWRQPGANELCLGPADAFPGSPSKCRCDLGFNVDIDVPPPVLSVEKSASPTSFDEPTGDVTFEVRVSNPSPFATVSLQEIADDEDNDGIDDRFYDPAVICGSSVLAPGAETSCSFSSTLTGNAGDELTDVVTVAGIDSEGRPVSDADDATVHVNDVPPQISVQKTANPTQVLEPGDDVVFSVVVTNHSVASDPVRIDSLTDDVHGDLNGRGDCSTPQLLQPGASYGCSFTAFVGGNAGTSETDVVTAAGQDDDGSPVTASDSATVNINDVPSMIELTKTASPTSVDEPGGLVTFAIVIDNSSRVDTVTIDALEDSIYGDLNGQGDCAMPQVLARGESYECSFTVFVAGNAFDSETNVATATGTDDDGSSVSDDDDATVSINNVQPEASLQKTAAMADVTFELVVANDSNAADPLTLSALEDDLYGDVTRVQGAVRSTTCAVPQTIEAGSSYACSFVARVAAPGEVDTVTGTVADDDGTAPLMPSDSARVVLE